MQRRTFIASTGALAATSIAAASLIGPQYLPGPIRRAGRLVKQELNPRALILMYHRIAEEQFDPWRLCVTPDNFRQQLEVLRSSGLHVMHLRELASSLAAGEIPGRSVAITFDDGYRDNLDNGRPLLDRYGIPATFFIASGYIGSDGEFWWDAMDRVLLEPGELPPSFDLQMGRERRSWQLGRDAVWTEEEAMRHRGWKPYSPPQTLRQRLYIELRELLLRVSPSERAKAIGDLLAWGGNPATARPKRRILDENGLRRLAANDLVEIGGHSVSHPALALMSPADQDHELRTSKHQLERIVGREVVAFAYPLGSYNADTERLARQAGYALACCSKHRPVKRGVDLYQLPRIGARNVPGVEFKAVLDNYVPL